MSKKGPKSTVIAQMLTLASKTFERVKTGDCDRATSFSARDCLMSALAIFTFKFPSMLQFDTASHQNQKLISNLRNLFGVERAPTDSTLRRRIDEIDSKHIHRALRTAFGWLRRNRFLDPFRVAKFDNLVPLMVDGTGYYTSTKVRCKHCLKSVQRDGKTRYRHAVLCAVVAHPDVKQVLPVAAEPIVKKDGDNKQDCEQNAFKRLFSRLVKERFGLRFIVIADALFTSEPVVKQLVEAGHSFILVCKGERHAHALSFMKGRPFHRSKKEDWTMTFRWKTGVPLNASAGKNRLVTVVEQTEIKIVDGEAVQTTWTWVTDLEVKSVEDARQVARLGRRRWAIENETYRTLKSQDGYHAEHNYGHGEEHLCTNMMLLMLLAFLHDQAAALRCKRFAVARNQAGSFRNLWETQRAIQLLCVMASWDELYGLVADTWPQAP